MEVINYTNINKHIAKVFKYHRKRNNYTQEQIAELTGLSSKYISQLERGISGGTLETILKLCNVYNISPNSILETFLNPQILENSEDLSEKFGKLCVRDREIVNNLVDLLLNNGD